MGHSLCTSIVVLAKTPPKGGEIEGTEYMQLNAFRA